MDSAINDSVGIAINLTGHDKDELSMFGLVERNRVLVGFVLISSVVLSWTGVIWPLLGLLVLD